MGHTVATGDFNGDGIADLMIGAPGAAGSELDRTGRVYIIYGKKTFITGTVIALSTDTADYTILGDSTDQLLGYSVAAGDLNNDGKKDCIIGAPYLESAQGKVYVQFGRSGYDDHAALDLTYDETDVKILGRYDTTYSADVPTLLMGFSVASADVSGDGKDDLVMSAPLDPRPDIKDSLGSQNLAGVVYAFRGGSSVFTSGATIDLSAYYANYEIYGALLEDYIGNCLTLADVTGDKRADFILGCPKMNSREWLSPRRLFSQILFLLLVAKSACRQCGS